MDLRIWTLRLLIAKPLLPEANSIVRCLVFCFAAVIMLCLAAEYFSRHLKRVFGVIWEAAQVVMHYVTLLASMSCFSVLLLVLDFFYD